MKINSVLIEYNGMRPYVHEAVSKANALLQNEQFYQAIMQQSRFDMADISPVEIAVMMRNANISMQVELYYAMSPVKNIDGYQDPEHPGVLFLNIWQLERPLASVCNTLVHGCVHQVNARYQQYSFGHGDSTPSGKENTAPYFIGHLAQRMVSTHATDYIPMVHDTLLPGYTPIKDHLKKYESRVKYCESSC